MSVNLWFFLSVSVFMGLSFAIFVIYLSHKKEMKILEIEALKISVGNTAKDIN